MQRDTVQDPVCGMRLSKADTVASAEWSGRRYYFCSQVCKSSFETTPRRYALTSEDATDRVVRIPLVALVSPVGARWPAERGLKSVPGVLEVYVDPADEAVYLTVDPTRFRLPEAVAEIERFGARAIVPDDSDRSA